METWRSYFNPPRFKPPLRKLLSPAFWDPKLGYFTEPDPKQDTRTRILALDAEVWATLSEIDLIGEYRDDIFRKIRSLCSLGYWDVKQTPFLASLVQAWWEGGADVWPCCFGWWAVPFKWQNAKAKRVVKARGHRHEPHRIHQPLFMLGLELQVRMWERAYRQRLHKDFSAVWSLWSGRPQKILGLRRTLNLLKERGCVGMYSEHLRRGHLTDAEEMMLKGDMCLPPANWSHSLWDARADQLELFPVCPSLVESFWTPMLPPGWRMR